jgi:AraC-like DNA-binding protein
MIERNAGTLSDIAQTTGFNSLSYFSYSYKKFYGLAPSHATR